MAEKIQEELFKKQFNEQNRKIRTTLTRVKHKIAVLSGKGGVGKSTIAVNLAMAFRWEGNYVGILDADIHGPSVPKILGVTNSHPMVGSSGIIPVLGPMGIKVMSMSFLLESEVLPVVWRGPLKSSVITQFLSDVYWGELDYLFIDLPPGTGDEALTIVQRVPNIDGVVIVTIPSEVSQIVVEKAVTFAKELKVPVIGIIENMSGLVCPNCGTLINVFKTGGGERIAKDLEVPFLGKIPLDPHICEDSDEGTPFIIKHADSPASKAFMILAKKIEEATRSETRMPTR